MIKKVLLKKFRFLIVLLCLALSGVVAFAKDDNTTKIEIEGADNSTYKKNEKDGSDEIILSGNVVVSVEKGSTKLKIKSDSITYNRNTETLYASGNIELVQSGSSGGDQTITASTLIVNTSTLEGIFDNGRAIHTSSDALNLPSGSTLIVASRMFGRDSSSTIAFKHAELTFCDDENPHWKIKASRIWLLPGGEFAFLNAVVSIGHVPVLYLPAFYYPKDELIFNPSFGYRERHGYYFQTTTYILGRKPLEPKDNTASTKASSAEELTKGIFNFMKPSVLKKQKREGLVLHNLDEDYKGKTSNYLKLIGDYYTNLGAVAGIDGSFAPSNEYISSINATAKLAWTNTVFFNNGVYTPYSSDGEKFNDKANFLGIETPFRYAANFKAGISKPFTFNLSMPIFSDPFFTEDFDSRSEYLDWISFFMSNNSKEKTDKEDTSSQTSSFTWNADASYKFPLPDFVFPYITNLSISNLSASIIFNSKSRGDSKDSGWKDFSSEWKEKTPERAFFYPSQVTPIKISGRIEGTIFQYPAPVKKSGNKNVKFPTEMNIPYYIMTDKEKEAYDKKQQEFEEKKKEELAKKEAAEKGIEYVPPAKNENDKTSDNEKEKKEETFVFESLDIKATSGVKNINDAAYSLTYTVNPQYSSQLTYDSKSIPAPEDFAWSNLYSSYYHVQVPTTVASSLNLKDSFMTLKNSFTFNPVYQTHPNLDGYTTESSKNSVKLSDYKAKKMDLTNTNTVGFRPFVFSEYFKNTGLDWNTTIKLVKTNFIGDAENPEWEYITADVTDDESVTTHTLSATLAATEDKFSQSFVLTTNLPPQKEEYNGTLTFTFPYFTTSASTGIFRKVKEEPDFAWNQFKQSATLKLLDGDLSFTESYNYEMEEKYHDSLKLSAAWKNVQLAYTMQYTTVYDFDGKSGWKAKTDKEFVPYQISLAYATKNKKYRYWKKRITWAPSLSTSIVYDCVRPTNSYFRFVPSISFNIHDQFELTFSAESQNNVIFRYFQDYVGYPDAIAGEKNVFKDLWNSFAVWGNGQFVDPEQSSRKSSGFKIKNFKVGIKRILHDWTMEGNVTFKPRYVTNSDGSKEFDYHPYITFCISWHPMPSMKTNIVDDYGEWTLNP